MKWGKKLKILARPSERKIYKENTKLYIFWTKTIHEKHGIEIFESYIFIYLPTLTWARRREGSKIFPKINVFQTQGGWNKTAPPLKVKV